MLRLALLFLFIALLAALFGFTGLALISLDAARILFFVFLVLAMLSFLANFLRGAQPRDLI
jgi:uncharacterized membrane protein YtjA (UPF0391 family)